MAYPFDQIGALGKANGQFAASLAQIARESGQTYTQLWSKATVAMFDQLKEMKPGVAPAFKSEPVTGYLGEIEKVREDSVAKVKDAFDDWQAGCKEAFAQATDGQQTFIDSVTAWFPPQTKTPAAPAKAGAAPAPRAPAKSGGAS